MAAISWGARCLPRLLAGAALLTFGGIDPVLHATGLGTYVVSTSAKDGDGASGKGGGESSGHSGGHDSGGDHGGSNSDGGHGSDDGGGEDGSNSGDGKGNRDRRGEDRRKETREVRRYMNMVSKRGTVVWSRVAPGLAELRYSDGWSESVKGGRYSLRDRANRVVAERPARASDLQRLSTASAGSR